MKDKLGEALADVLVFVLAFAMSTGACAKKAVNCGAERIEAPAQAR